MSDRSVSSRRRTVARRARGRCEYCLSPADCAPDPFAVEHILPHARGGTSRLTNLAYSCQGCNNHKYTSIEAVDPVSGERVPLYNPRRDRWREHFGWSEDFMRLVGLTAVGRATVERLRLNRVEVVNLRRLLRAVGEHPPPETVEGA